MESLIEVLMRRDELTKDEAVALIEDAKQQVRDGGDPEEILQDEFGLEPDYFFDLIDL